MIKKVLTTSIFLSVMMLSLPLVVQAQGIVGIIGQIEIIIVRLVPLIIGLAVLVFLWGVLQYAIAKDDGGKEAAKGYMLWGLIALFVMVSVWGLVTILSETILGNRKINSAPTIPRPIESLNVGSGSR